MLLKGINKKCEAIMAIAMSIALNATKSLRGSKNHLQFRGISKRHDYYSLEINFYKERIGTKNRKALQ